MVALTLVARCLLGGTFAVVAGLAAAAEPPAPMALPSASAVQAGPLAAVPRPVTRGVPLPAARWDGRDGAEGWTRAALEAAAAEGGLAALLAAL